MDYSTLKMPQDSIVFICLGVLSFNWQQRRKLWRSKACSQLGTLPPIIQGLSGLYPSACFQIQSPITMVCYCSVFAPSTYAFFYSFHKPRNIRQNPTDFCVKKSYTYFCYSDSNYILAYFILNYVTSVFQENNTLLKNFPLKNPTNCPAIFIKIFYASPFRRLLAFASLALHPLRKMQKT